MPESRLEYLFYCYVNEKCSPEEEKELMALLVQSRNELHVKNLIDKITEDAGSEIPMSNEVAASILQNVFRKDKAKVLSLKNVRTNFKLWLRVVAAAVVILFISGVSYWIFSKENKGRIAAATIPTEKLQAILPGGNHAILTMGDGRTIILDSVQKGSLQNGIVTINKQDGLLVYNGQLAIKTSKHVTNNTLITPRGGQYQVVLSDGSKVWLNASSSLHFPTAFVGKNRDVELTGEAYFEVAKNKEKTFHVKVNGMQIEVLGTHFNVNAYSGEDAIRTSLLEGSVKITDGSESGILKPGQQGILDKKEDKLKIKVVDMNEVMAWKNGLFEFDGAGIKTIMSEISRWYDVDIVYSGKVPTRSFEGKISRRAQLSDVLKILELSNVKFIIEGKNIIVE